MNTGSIIATCMTNFENVIGNIGIIIFIVTSGIVFTSSPNRKIIDPIDFFIRDKTVKGIKLSNILRTLTVLIFKANNKKCGNFHEKYAIQLNYFFDKMKYQWIFDPLNSLVSRRW